MTKNILSEEDKDVDISVSLALIEKNLKEINEKNTQMSHTLYGNGTIEGSIVWALKELSTDVKQINELIQKLPCKNITDCNKTTWEEVLKKVTIKAPYAIALIVIVVLLHQPSAAILMSFLKMLHIACLI